jgi:SAM-dependent methyltransferase
MTDFWDVRYAEPDYAYGSEPNDFLAGVADQLPPRGHVLCLADGQGRNGVFLAARGHHVTAMDQSAVGLARARALAAERDVTIETVVADLATFPIAPDAWDAIVSIFVHLPPDLRAHVARGVVRGLRPGGMVVLEVYSPRQLAHDTGGPKEPDRFATLTQLQEAHAGFEWLIARELERDVIEGRYHTGAAWVIQLLGRKPGTPT